MRFQCVICHADKGEIWLRDVRDFEHNIPFESELWKCQSCSTVQQHPFPEPKDLLRFYPPDYHAYHYGKSPLGVWLKVRYCNKVGRRIRKLVGPEGKILDVGCADGLFLSALEPMASWELCGIDLNPEVIQKPKSKNLHLRAGQLEKDTYDEQTFDAIVMIHVIEHVTDPLETLRTCFRILRPGGIVIGELPNIDCWDFKLFRRYWGGLHLPRHLSFWNPKTFRNLALVAGFSDAQVYPVMQPAHWAISIQNLIVNTGLFQRWLRYGRLPCYSLAVLLSAPLSMLQNLSGKPSIIGFLLRKF